MKKTRTAKQTRTANRRRGGFTLMEMLVVLAILVVLLSMVGPRILGSRQKADISATKSQIGMLRASLEGYALDMKDFPTTEQGLSALIEKPKDDKGAAAAQWDGPYVSKSSIPKDPWNHDYQYEYPPTHGKDNNPDIWSLGKDGEDGTDDDIVSWTDEDSEHEQGGASKTNRQANAN